jgi:hypothetical protein
VNVQHQLRSGLTATASYVAGRGKHLLVVRDFNPVLQSPTTGLFEGNNNRVNPNLNNFFRSTPAASSDYNGLQLSLDGKIVKGLQAHVYYTWSKELDNSSNSFSSTTSLNGSSTQVDPYNINYDRGYSAYNTPQNLSVNILYELPFKGNRLVEGYQLSLITSVHSGSPYSADIGFDQSGVGSPSIPERPNLVGNPDVAGPVAANPNAACQAGGAAVVSSVHNATHWFNPCAFSLPAAGTLGNLYRNSLVGPDYSDVDLSLSKLTNINERFKVQFRAEFFNLPNHTDFALPSSYLNVFSASSAGVPVPSAGEIVTTPNTSRQIQFGLKLLF